MNAGYATDDVPIGGFVGVEGSTKIYQKQSSAYVEYYDLQKAELHPYFFIDSEGYIAINYLDEEEE